MHCLNNAIIMKKDLSLLIALRDNNYYFVEEGDYIIGVYDAEEYYKKTGLYDFNYDLLFEIASSCNVERFLIINTDYFGGVGEQDCTLFHSYNENTKKYIHQICKSINNGLNILGIELLVKDPKDPNYIDEFDFLSLGKYRDNDSFIPEEELEEIFLKELAEKKEKEDLSYNEWKTRFESFDELTKLKLISVLLSGHLESSISPFSDHYNQKDDSAIIEFNRNLARYLSDK